MVSLLITAVIFAILIYVLFWAMGLLGVPDPIVKVITVIVVLIAVIWLLQGFLPLAGVGLMAPRHYLG